MTGQAEQLISDLATDLTPVRPLRPPLLRAAIWLAIAVTINAIAVALHGLRPDILSLLKTPSYTMLLAATVLTGLLAAIAVFQISIPGRSPRWALLPVPGLILWVASAGYGCLTDWIRMGPEGLALGTSFHCFSWIVGLSLPLSLGLYLMVRHAAWIRPGLTLTLGMLSTAALVAAGLSLFHPLDTSLMILIWHGGSTLLLVGLSTLGIPLFRPQQL